LTAFLLFKAKMMNKNHNKIIQLLFCLELVML